MPEAAVLLVRILFDFSLPPFCIALLEVYPFCAFRGARNFSSSSPKCFFGLAFFVLCAILFLKGGFIFMTSNSKTMSLRLKNDIIEKLDYLCSLNGLSRSQFVSSCIKFEYDKVFGNPDLVALVSQLRDLTLHINDYFSPVEPKVDSPKK